MLRKGRNIDTQDRNTDKLFKFLASYHDLLERGIVSLDKGNRFLNKVIAVGVVLIIVKFSFDL